MKAICVALAMWATSASVEHDVLLHKETCCIKSLKGSTHCLPCDVYYWLTSCTEIEL